MTNSKPNLTSKEIKILFVCHASTSSGMGHLFRTCIVARAAAQYANTKVAMLGMHSLCSKFKHDLPETHFIDKLAQLKELVATWNPDCICFDLLEIEGSIFNELVQGRLSVSISPVFSHLSQVDMLFHRTTTYPEFWDEFSHKVKIFANLKYTVLDERIECISTGNLKKLLASKALPVGISMGGTDAPNKTLALLNSFKNLPVPMLFWVLLGEGYTHSYKDLVNTLEGSQHEILLIKSNKSMWQILSQCALVFLAGGLTTFEAAYAGLPSVNLLEDENRTFLMQELESKGCLVSLWGDSKELNKTAMLELCALDKDREKIMKMHLSAKKCGIDNLGATRIVKTIIYHLLENNRS